MRIGIFIDYANLYINIKNEFHLSSNAEVESKISHFILKLEEYLYSQNEFGGNIEICKKIAYVLENQGFGNPEDTLSSNNVLVKKIGSLYKTEDMKEMNQSQCDDEALMQDAMDSAKKLDVILVISNDGDYSNLGKKIINYTGSYFWVGVYRGNACKPSRYLMNIADKVLPIHDIINEIDEPEAVIANEEPISITDPYLAVYYRGKNILNYPVNKDYIDIGRRSVRRFHFPNIDLSEFDFEKTVSRQHCFIRRVGDQLIFVVDENCSRGTWLNTIPMHNCEQIILKPGMEVVLGDIEDGFGIEYVV